MKNTIKNLPEDTSAGTIVVDETEFEIERLQKKKKYYSGKKKRHTLKIQIIAVSGGNKHDFKLFKENRFIIPETAFIIADKGHQGISDMHFRSLVPVKATKNHKLNDFEKAFNSDLFHL